MRAADRSWISALRRERGRRGGLGRLFWTPAPVLRRGSGRRRRADRPPAGPAARRRARGRGGPAGRGGALARGAVALARGPPGRAAGLGRVGPGALLHRQAGLGRLRRGPAAGRPPRAPPAAAAGPRVGPLARGPRP